MLAMETLLSQQTQAAPTIDIVEPVDIAVAKLSGSINTAAVAREGVVLS
jgi:hypothetical protein